jgi:RNA polymerase sigma-70 factor (ECF subfamily)
VLLEDQDRTRWDQAEIAEGQRLVERSLRLGRLGPYQLQAAIAALHAEARTAAETDWAQIATLYCILGRVSPSPIVELNHAAAVAMAEGCERGLELMAEPAVAEPLADYRWFHSARADLLRRLGRHAEARLAYLRALELTRSAPERAFLQRRLQEVCAGIEQN